MVLLIINSYCSCSHIESISWMASGKILAVTIHRQIVNYMYNLIIECNYLSWWIDWVTVYSSELSLIFTPRPMRPPWMYYIKKIVYQYILKDLPYQLNGLEFFLRSLFVCILEGKIVDQNDQKYDRFSNIHFWVTCNMAVFGWIFLEFSCVGLMWLKICWSSVVIIVEIVGANKRHKVSKCKPQSAHGCFPKESPNNLIDHEKSLSKDLFLISNTIITMKRSKEIIH